MITRIELRNFMSHEHTVIEPASGLTVLVGPNNCGKSAVVAALQILCHNENSTYVLRHGQKECSVQITTDDGHSIQWRRRKSPSYVIDGVEFSRLNQSGLPPELHQALRLAKVDAGNDADFDVHFGTQKDPIFLLRSSSGNAARFFASSSDAIHLVEMQKRHKEKLAAARSEKVRKDAESLKLNAEIEALAPAVEVEQRIQAAERLYTELCEQAARLQAAEELAGKLEAQQRELARHDAEATACRELVAPPQLADVAPLERLLVDLQQAQQRERLAADTSAALRKLDSPPAQHDTLALGRVLARLDALTSERERSQSSFIATQQLAEPPLLADSAALARTINQLLSATSAQAEATDRRKALAAMTPPPQLADASHLARWIGEFERCASAWEHAQSQTAALASLEISPLPLETTSLLECIRRWQAVERQRADCQAALREVESELLEAEEALRAAAGESVCPTCGAVLDADRVVALAAAGGGHLHA
jgi:energy-coupling factor transporter ATP-binding protein EcfA2